jgi:SAM-dependent methyltransferase
MMLCSHNQRIEHQYDVISQEFDMSRVRIWKSVKEFITNHNSSNKKLLLDVGVGNGKNILFANEYNYECIGIDISTNLLEICRQKRLNVHKKDVLHLNKSFGMFDTILCIATIHHLENIMEQTQAILNMIDCLNPHGNLLISVWSIEIFNNDEKKDYRHFNVGPNLVEWNSKDKQNKIDRFYFIHNYDSFHGMIEYIASITPIHYEIKWEKQNWFCEIMKM